jgi:hypothetical protein
MKDALSKNRHALLGALRLNRWELIPRSLLREAGAVSEVRHSRMH